MFFKKRKERVELTQRELLETLLKEQKEVVSSSNLDEQVKKLEELKKQLLK